MEIAFLPWFNVKCFGRRNPFLLVILVFVRSSGRISSCISSLPRRRQRRSDNRARSPGQLPRWRRSPRNVAGFAFRHFPWISRWWKKNREKTRRKEVDIYGLDLPLLIFLKNGFEPCPSGNRWNLISAVVTYHSIGWNEGETFCRLDFEISLLNCRKGVALITTQMRSEIV